jgi:crossover junction endodeoxyribonuclease RusA
MTKRAIFQPARRGGKSWAAALASGDQAKPKKAARAPRPRPDPKPIDDIADLPPGPRVIVPFPPVELSPNWRGHWSKKSPVTKAYRRLCWALALNAGLKVPAYAAGGAQIVVRLDFFPPTRASRDDDNIPASFKAGRDGIADALKCDDARFRTVPVLRAEPRSCVVVTLVDPDQGEAP